MIEQMRRYRPFVIVLMKAIPEEDRAIAEAAVSGMVSGLFANGRIPTDAELAEAVFAIGSSFRPHVGAELLRSVVGSMPGQRIYK